MAELGLAEAGRAVVLGQDWGVPIAAAYREIGGIGLRQLLADGAIRAYRYGGQLTFGLLAVALIVLWVRSTT